MYGYFYQLKKNYSRDVFYLNIKKLPYLREANVLKVVVVVLLNYSVDFDFLHYIIFSS
jgi:hypothetical protein